MAAPSYVRRIARLLDVFDQLQAHPDGVPVATLAEECGIDLEELREDLLAYYAADPGIWLGLSRRRVLEWTGTDSDQTDEDDEVDPTRALTVRLVEEPQDLGVEYLDAGELALIHAAASALLDVRGEGKDLALESAIDVIAETLMGDSDTTVQSSWRPANLDLLQQASAQRKKVRIRYSRQWETGVVEGTIEPWRLVQTTVRGWEVDAGPVAANGKLRTYLVSNVREVNLLEETFALPDDAETLLSQQRATTRVRMNLPHRARWALDEYAEASAVVADSDDGFTADVELLEPVGWRVGLITLAAGSDTRVLRPSGLLSEGPALARRLLAHHEAEPGEW
ncbi:WYL domain-containing protein [Nocardioides dubius]|uniref:WYL domain-containing protein n=1 Tax=Nocardioides dubius TaxID=317019 RepID=A0ABN1TKD5_9ACTN